MTRSLAITTATAQIGVALADGDALVREVRAHHERRHGEQLAPAIRSILADAGWRLADLDRVAVDVGPGLFTGLRVGLATAKALASALNIDLVGCSSLELLARAHGGDPRPVASVVDARRGEVFVAVFAPDPGPGPAPEIVEPTVCAPAQLVDILNKVHAAEGPLLATGDGARRYLDDLTPVTGIEVAGPDFDHPRPGVLALMAPTLQPQPPSALAPIYLRGADVRIGWEQRGG